MILTLFSSWFETNSSKKTSIVNRRCVIHLNINRNLTAFVTSRLRTYWNDSFVFQLFYSYYWPRTNFEKCLLSTHLRRHPILSMKGSHNTFYSSTNKHRILSIMIFSTSVTNSKFASNALQRIGERQKTRNWWKI